MAAQAASLRDVVERQGGEVAALRAAAAIAEAESMAAKTELLQVRETRGRLHLPVRQAGNIARSRSLVDVLATLGPGGCVTWRLGFICHEQRGTHCMTVLSHKRL